MSKASAEMEIEMLQAKMARRASAVVTLLFVGGLFLDAALVLFVRFTPFPYDMTEGELDPEIAGVVAGLLVAGMAIADGILTLRACVEDAVPRRHLAVARVVIECILLVFVLLLFVLPNSGQWRYHWRAISVVLSLTVALVVTGFAAVRLTKLS